jgi:hypothetical protein
MENLKALLAVSLFIATILFANIEKEQRKEVQDKNTLIKQEQVMPSPDTLQINR